MNRLKRKHFTIMELMGVLIIMGLLMTMTFKADLFSGGAGTNIGMQMLSTQLRLARQYAITHRERVAVLIPAKEFDQSWDTGDTSDMTFRSKSFRTCIVDRSNTFEEFVPNTNWGYLPTGAIVLETGEPNDAVHASPKTTSVTDVPFFTSNPRDPAEAHAVRAVIYKEDGSVVGSADIGLTVRRGFVIGQNLGSDNADDQRTCSINWLTGAIAFD